MMPVLSTPVIASPLPFRIDLNSHILSLGSCFSDEIGHRMAMGGLYVEKIPFGTLSNPASICNAIRRILDDRPISTSDLVQHEGLWHSWHHHGSFSQPSANQTLEACNNRLHQAHLALQHINLLSITFGTAWVFELLAAPDSSNCKPFDDWQLPAPSVVSNCHKLPRNLFSRRKLTIEEITTMWHPLINELLCTVPSLQILFTVSPTRHLADGAHGNQLSKSTLLLAVDQLVSDYSERVFYFPAYEIVLDELRDYRFFGPDMSHPSPLAADIVWHRFQEACMTPNVIQQIHNNAKRNLQKQHIPLHQK